MNLCNKKIYKIYQKKQINLLMMVEYKKQLNVLKQKYKKIKKMLKLGEFQVNFTKKMIRITMQ